MQNRAKCKLCGDTIQSFHRHDLVHCKCGEIGIDGGNDFLHCSARDWNNFLRVDDLGNEIQIKVRDVGQMEEKSSEPSLKMTRKEQIDMFETMVKGLENLPQGAMGTPINHWDLCSYLLIILSILKTSEDE